MDTRTALDRESQRFDLRPDAFERLLRRRHRKERSRRLSAGALALVIALVSLLALTRAFHTGERPMNEPPRPPGIFSKVGGWIVYGTLGEKCEPSPCWTEVQGIWAVDPSPDPDGQVQLSKDTGTPIAWSNDGSKLLILRGHRVPDRAFGASDLFVLNADGTETRLTEGDAWLTGGSFSADGSKVVYAAAAFDGAKRPGILVVDSAGGRSQVLLTGSDLAGPTFSPDGSKIAYFAGDRLRVMNADGSGSGDLTQHVFGETGHGPGRLVWSPDGTRLAIDYGGDIYTIMADGSGLTLVIPDGGTPNWSPDGSHIAYNVEAVTYPPGPHLEIAEADGRNSIEFFRAGSGPWNPLAQPEPEVAEVPAASQGLALASPLLLVVALPTLVVGAVLIGRRKVHRSRP